MVATDATLVFTCCIIRENVVRGQGDNGEAPKGGGLYLSGGSASMRNCLVTDNEPEGFYGKNTQTELIGCRFENNLGSGAVNTGRATVVNECSFTNNSLQGLWSQAGCNLRNSEFLGNAGSGLVFWGRGLVFNCRFIENGARGMNVSQSRALIEDCLFEGNTAQFGGGLISQGSDVDTLIGCTFRNNLATVTGGAIRSAQNTSIKLYNCIFEGNLADNGQGVGWGGAVYGRAGAYFDLVNCTLFGNRAGTGGAIAAGGGNNPLIKNSILYNNGEHPIDFTGGGGNIIVRYSLVEGGRDGVINTNGNINWLDGNLDEDPLFVDPDNGDYHLTADSPCIDTGDPNSPPDPDGTRADMGAFYFNQNQPPRVVVEIPDLTIEEDCGQVAVARLDTVFADLEEDEISFFLNGDERLGLSIDEANLLSMNLALNFFGDSLSVSVFAFDEVDKVSTAFLVTVTPVNDPPSAFSLLAPENESEVRGNRNTIFSWESSTDPDGDTEVHYCLTVIVFWTDEYIDTTQYDCGVDSSFTLTNENKPESWYYGGDHIPMVDWWVQAVSGTDTTNSSNRFRFGFVASINEDPSVVREFSLQPAFPNPFNSSTLLRYSLPAPGWTSLTACDLNGREVARIDESWRGAGEYTVRWEATGLPSGAYLLRLDSGGQAAMRMLTLVK